MKKITINYTTADNKKITSEINSKNLHTVSRILLDSGCYGISII